MGSLYSVDLATSLNEIAIDEIVMDLNEVAMNLIEIVMALNEIALDICEPTLNLNKSLNLSNGSK